MLHLRFALPLLLFAINLPLLAGDGFSVSLRSQTPVEKGSDNFHRTLRTEQWKASETAVIVCDMWDAHHCLNAVRREKQFAPRLNKMLVEARQRGAIIIHCPSSCMTAYADHAARKRAIEAPKAESLPQDIGKWCYEIPAEEMDKYPIDQSDGGEDDDPQEHAKWAAELKSMGLNAKAPWKRQIDLIEINAHKDYITDKGDEVWNILQHRKIKNVFMTGVHTNMCVLGRPFGLRRLASNGVNVALVRDLTDTMYNPLAKPYVSHFSGTDLIVSHIEKYVCPTVTSDQILGGKPFVFKKDDRPHIAIIIAEKEYETKVTLPKFAADHLNKEFRVSYYYAKSDERNNIPGLAQLKEADVLLVSVRRRALPKEQLKHIRDFVAAGKPVIGIRTASHAFSLRSEKAPEGHDVWPEFDAEVFGGNYHGHHANKLKSQAFMNKANSKHEILGGWGSEAYSQGGSFYQTSPLADGTTELLFGTLEGQKREPIAWTFKRADGGKSFYTSLGHKDDFHNKRFQNLLRAAVYWAAGKNSFPL